MIENKSIADKYRKEDESLVIKGPENFLNREDFELARREYYNKRDNINNRFYAELLKEYNITKSVIDFAEKIEDESDNGYSFFAIEMYVVMILNFLEDLKSA